MFAEEFEAIKKALDNIGDTDNIASWMEYQDVMFALDRLMKAVTMKEFTKEKP